MLERRIRITEPAVQEPLPVCRGKPPPLTEGSRCKKSGERRGPEVAGPRQQRKAMFPATEFGCRAMVLKRGSQGLFDRGLSYDRELQRHGKHGGLQSTVHAAQEPLLSLLPVLSQRQESPSSIQSFLCSWDTHLLSKHEFFPDVMFPNL